MLDFFLFLCFFYCTDTEFYSGYGVALGLLLGFMFEEKYVKFEYCQKWWTYILINMES